MSTWLIFNRKEGKVVASAPTEAAAEANVDRLVATHAHTGDTRHEYQVVEVPSEA